MTGAATPGCRMVLVAINKCSRTSPAAGKGAGESDQAAAGLSCSRSVGPVGADLTRTGPHPAGLALSAGGFVRIYSIGEGGRSLELLHKTRVEGIVGALAAFRGRLLVGLETTLRLYDLGKKKLLRKCEHRK